MFKRISTLLSFSLLALAGPASRAQQAPVPPLVRMVVPAAAGASTDIMARAIAPQLAARLGTNVIVENRAGASGMLGASVVAKAPKDGSALLFFSVSLISAAATTRNPSVDVLTELLPVAAVAENPLVFAVSTKSDIKTPADLVAAARAKPDLITHGTGGVGTIAHVAAELFNNAAKVQLKHVPYRGAAPAVVDLVSGTIDLMIATNATFASQIKAGRARPIGVTSRQPSAAFPGLPTMNTVAPGYESGLWVGMWAPAGTPPAIVQRLNKEIVEIARSKELGELLQADGGAPLALTPEEFAARVRSDYADFKKLATDKNIVVE